jgi:hypothetical protein
VLGAVRCLRGLTTRAIFLPPYHPTDEDLSVGTPVYYGYDEAPILLRPVYAFSRVRSRFPL